MCDLLPPAGAPRPPLDRRRLLGALAAGAGALALGACVPPGGRTVRAVPRGGGPPPLRPPPPRRTWRVVPREAWGAEPLKDNHDPMARVTRVTLHHTAELPGMATRADAQLVKAVQHFHRNERGWADIGYHWLIGRDGLVYEGRALSVQGAHAGGGNNVENLGVSAIGDFRAALPCAAQLRTLRIFLAAQLARHGLGAEDLHGHRDFKPTECPGDALYAWLQEIKRASGRA